jgi:Ca-activated chloride channel family protein
MTLRARQDRHLVRPNYRSNRFVLVDITAPTSRRAPTREPLNAAFVLDRSGSMAGRKIGLARDAIDASIGALSEQDRFAVVSYDEHIDVVAPSAPATDSARSAAREALARIDARGSTNLFEGWMRGCQQVADHQGGTAGMHRVLLMTDGLANVGVTDPEELVRHATELGRRGIATWTFGFGSDFDEALLERMAVAGGGQSFYVEDPAQIRDYITGAVGEALDVVARDVALRVEAGEGVVVEPLRLFRAHVEAPATVVELGDLVSGQHLRLVLRLNFPYGDVGRERTVRLSLTDREGVFRGSEAELTFEYADHRANDLQGRDREVDREVARTFAARARKAAAEHNKAGSYRLAEEALRGVARRIRGYAGDDPELLRIVASLEGEYRTVAAPMAASAQKQMHYESTYLMRGRDVQGRAQRRP